MIMGEVFGSCHEVLVADFPRMWCLKMIDECLDG